MAALQSPGLATGYEAAAVSAPACLGHDIELRQIAVATLLFQHKEVAGGIMGKRPAYRLFILLRDEEDAVPFGAAMPNHELASKPGTVSATVGTPGSTGLGTLLGGNLETSSVDLSDQLTNLIVAQEAYQANTKVITTSTTVMQSLMSMS